MVSISPAGRGLRFSPVGGTIQQPAWQPVDLTGLATLRATSLTRIAASANPPIRRRPASLDQMAPVPAALPAIELANQRPRLAQIGDGDFVVIGRSTESRRRYGARPVAPAQVANDNAAGAKLLPTRPRSALRDAFFLAVLGATLFGAFYSGRMHGFQKVIIIPEPMGPRAVLT